MNDISMLITMSVIGVVIIVGMIDIDSCKCDKSNQNDWFGNLARKLF